MAEQKKIGIAEYVRRFFLDLDARIDSGLFEAGRWARELYERFVTFMDRFHVAGWKRWALVEPASEAATSTTTVPSSVITSTSSRRRGTPADVGAGSASTR